MSLNIKTFSNQSGGNAFYKAVTHPCVADKAKHLTESLRRLENIAFYDPLGQFESFSEFFPLDSLDCVGFFVQDVDQIGRNWNGLTAQPVTRLRECSAKHLFIAAFDATKFAEHISLYLPKGCEIHSFDSLRLPEAMISDRRTYLANINFATNFAFFRDSEKHHTRLVTVNYWSAYGSVSPRMWCCLLDGSGKNVAEWFETLPAANASIIIDSAEVRQRFKLAEFTGQLFVHVIGAAGHDVVKYALDTYGDEDHTLSCTHDANAWPSDKFAGLPAPTDDETVVVWLQNSHPRTVEAREVGISLMGDNNVITLTRSIPPYGTFKLDVSTLLPDARWPEQIELQAGKNFVRPRYEITTKSNGHMRIAHPNVERDDLKPDPQLSQLKDWFGKGFILPAPILPLDKFFSTALPTPMASSQQHLPVKAHIYDARGKFILEHRFGNLKRKDSVAVVLNELIGGQTFDGNYGHVELMYDFASGNEADGWLHALFRYQDKKSGHSAETSFGAHIFNSVLTFKNEPQSYGGRAPGLSTRLFLRVGPRPLETLCHLIYPTSKEWNVSSDTTLVLTSSLGTEIAKKNIRIVCGGSLLWKVSELFTLDQLNAAGAYPYITVRDTTCRLFGYHGLISGEQAFSLDHMFGF